MGHYRKKGMTPSVGILFEAHSGRIRELYLVRRLEVLCYGAGGEI